MTRRMVMFAVLTLFPTYAFAQAIGHASGRMMARCASRALIARQHRIEEEQLPQFNRWRMAAITERLGRLRYRPDAF